MSVTVYEDGNYRGKSLKLVAGSYPNLKSYNFNDKISSLKVATGYQCTVYVDDTYRGASAIFTGNTSSVGSSLNDKISSLKVEKLQSPSPVMVYQDSNYSGASQQFGEGSYPNLKNYNFNDKISSVKVAPGYQCVAYTDDNYRGCAQIFYDSVSYVGNDLNDKITSLKVEKISNNQMPQGTESLTNPTRALENITKSSNWKKITFDSTSGIPGNPLSHAQGYARYRGDGYDYHIFPYSNVVGNHGYLYIASEQRNSNGKSKFYFILQVPANGTEIQFQTVADDSSSHNPYFNHSCGVQVIGDYLLLPVIPARHIAPHFYDAALVYLYDLSSLKGSAPKAPTEFEEILRIPKVNGASLSCVGITKLKDGRFALGLMTDDNLDVYLTTSAPSDLWNAKWGESPEKKYRLEASAGKNHYQSIGFLRDKQDDVYVIGFDTRSSKDMADMYKLTTNGGSWRANGTLKPVCEKHLTATQGAEFSYGGGFEIRSSSELIVYAVESYYTHGGIRINYWR